MNSTAIVFCIVAGLTILAVFQNCAPALPLDGVVDSSSANVRATATPGSGAPTGITSGTVYTGSQFDGVCTWSSTVDAMASAGTDGQGNLIAFNNPTTGKAALWNVNAGGTLARASVCNFQLSMSGYSVQAIGDFNGDYNKDVLWRNNTTGDSILWLMYGSTRIQTGSLLNISSTYNIEGVADVDGDGKDDLILRDLSNNIVIAQMNGFTAPVFTTLTAHPTATQSIQAISTYYDPTTNKKKPAIFFTDSSQAAGTSAAHPVWYMNGTTVTVTSLPSGFVSGSTTSAGVTTTFIYSIVGIGDFTGDANADFLLKDPTTGAIRMRYSTYTGTALAVSPAADSSDYTFPATWTMQDVQKVNGDSTADIVWLVNGGTLPILQYSAVQGVPVNPTPLIAVQAGYTMFKYSHR